MLYSILGSYILVTFGLNLLTRHYWLYCAWLEMHKKCISKIHMLNAQMIAPVKLCKMGNYVLAHIVCFVMFYFTKFLHRFNISHFSRFETQHHAIDQLQFHEDERGNWDFVSTESSGWSRKYAGVNSGAHTFMLISKYRRVMYKWFYFIVYCNCLQSFNVCERATDLYVFKRIPTVL